MAVQRALIVSRQPLFAQALRSLLERNSDVVEVIGICTCGDDAPRVVREKAPDTVVVDVRDLTPELLPALLDGGPRVRVVSVSADDNAMRVYEGRQVMALQAQDLVDAVLQGQAPG